MSPNGTFSFPSTAEDEMNALSPVRVSSVAESFPLSHNDGDDMNYENEIENEKKGGEEGPVASAMSGLSISSSLSPSLSLLPSFF